MDAGTGTIFADRSLPQFAKILPLIPLISSTATLTHAISEHVYLSAFVASSRLRTAESSSTSSPKKGRSQRVKHDDVLPSVFNIYFNRGVIGVIGYGFTSVATGAINFYDHVSSSANIKSLVSDGTFASNDTSVMTDIAMMTAGLRRRGFWFLAGTCFAAAHFAFVPLVMYKVQNIIEDTRRRKKLQEVEKVEQSVKIERMEESGVIVGAEEGGDNGSKGQEVEIYSDEDGSTRDLEDWLKVHRWRLFTADLLAWATFVVATAL